MSEATGHAQAATRDNAFGLLRWLAMVAVAAIALGFLMSYVSRSVTVASPVPVSEDAGMAYDEPSFRLPVFEGQGPLGPPDFTGKVVVLDFWATWCGPCKLQAKFLEELHDELPANDVQFLAVNVGEDDDRVRAYVENAPFPYPLLMDYDSALLGRFPIHGLPTVMVVDRSGEISFLNVGITDKPTLAKKIEEALG